MITEAGINLYPKDPIWTEFSAYKLLKKNPIDGVNYLATPFSVMINHNQLKILNQNTKLNGGFAICQHIRYKEIIGLLKRIGIDTLFTPHVDKDHSDFKVLPFPHLAVNSSKPKKKDILASYIGAPTHPCRGALMKFNGQEGVHVKSRNRWHFEQDKNTIQKHKKEYIDVLSRSRFSFCPRGTGASTIRFWESLQAGAIPVLIADAMRLPIGFDWDQCVIRVKQSNASKALETIRKVDKTDETAMREAALKAYDLFSGDNFVRCIRLHYKNIANPNQ